MIGLVAPNPGAPGCPRDLLISLCEGVTALDSDGAGGIKVSSH